MAEVRETEEILISDVEAHRMTPKVAQWRQPLLDATCISLFILGLFYYWYGLANRHVIFLYEHVAGGTAGTPAQPFDETTSSRYWMAGLVASGAVMVLYTAVNWLRHHIAVWRKKPFVPSAWWRVWAPAAIPLSIGIPVITMNVNSPALPPALAAACVLATLVGLAVALLPGKWAAERPWDLVWLVADSAGLMPALLLLRVIELPAQGVSLSYSAAWRWAIGGVVAGAVWLAVMSILRIWRHRKTPSSGALLLGGLGLSYLLMPLAHYVLATPPTYRYITTASNFFAFNVGIQLLAVVVAAGLAEGITHARRRLEQNRRISP